MSVAMPLAILLAFEVLLLLMYIIDDPFRVRIDMWLFYSCQIASIIAVTLALAVVVHEESGEADPRIALFPVFVLGIYTFSLLARSSVYVKRWFDVRRRTRDAARKRNVRHPSTRGAPVISAWTPPPCPWCTVG